MKIRHYLSLGLLLAGSLRAENPGPDWQPAPGSLMTRWAAEVSPTNAHPEYPRPQLVRPDWRNLNGLWNYAVTPAAVQAPAHFEGKILVPFPIESSLSGVRRRLDENSTLWYQRQFRVPPAWAGRRVRIHFGAVDWQTRVFLNGHEIGQHCGGYDAFSFDITDSLNWTGEEVIRLAVSDPTEGDQPRGKQTRKPEGIFYTPSSGVWQTVWLEPVPQICIDDLRLTPDVDSQTLRVRTACGSRSGTLRVEVRAFAAGHEVGWVAGPVNEELRLPVAGPHLWSPEDPFLYDLRVTLKEGDKVADTVTSYFGMRKVAVHRDSDGLTRILLNDHFTFQTGTLDQGFWPDGIYTAPTDDALRFDIEYLKRAGFNLARKHVKVEPDRWYYWCDKLGLLVWQDMPSGNNTTPDSRTQFEIELQRLVEGRGNHPSIIVWVLFNEGWGQYDTERLVAWLKAQDPSRLVDNASGWTDKRVGDLIDVHSYPEPECPLAELDRAAVLGEFGGLGLALPGHTWSKLFVGDFPMPDSATLVLRHGQLLDRVGVLRNASGLSAAIYTQTTDVENECNGLLTYDRAISKIDPAVLKLANQGKIRDRPVQVVVPNALYTRAEWKFTTNEPAANWLRPDFDDTGWSRGIGGFGTAGTPGAVVETIWSTADIWLRRDFTLADEDLRQARFQLHHDEDTEIYLNGVLAAQAASFSTHYFETDILAAARNTLKPGLNHLAVHCRQTSGGQYIDVGIVISREDQTNSMPNPVAPK